MAGTKQLKMKKLMMLSMLVLAAVFAFAQKGKMDPEARIQKKVDRMAEQLNLSAAQQVEVKALLASQPKKKKKDGEKRSDLTEAEQEAKKAERKACEKTENDP